MEDAKTLPINQSIAFLVKAKIAKEISKLKLGTSSKSITKDSGKSENKKLKPKQHKKKENVDMKKDNAI